MQRPVPRRAAAAMACSLLWPVASPASARAETPSEASVEIRTVLSFRAPAEAVQRLLPAGWQVNPATTGPAQGANLTVVLTDRLITQDPDGRPRPGGSGPVVVLVVPARNPATGAAGPVVAGGFSAQPEAAPGAYGVLVPAEVRMERTVTAGPDGTRQAREGWSIAGGGRGKRLEIRLRYLAAAPGRTALEQRVYSARNPEFFRIYRVDQGTDVLRGAAGGADRVEEFALSAAGPQLGAQFDGSERLVAAQSLPWYVRRVSLP